LRSRITPAAVVAAVALSASAHAGPAVTLYTSNLAYIRETRALTLASSRDTVLIDNVPQQLDFSSVRLAPADASARVTRLAYRFDVASGDGLLEKARGERVRITTEHERVVEGTLIAADGGWLVVRADDGSVQSIARDAVETLRLANPPVRMALRPSLEAVIEGGKKGKLDAELSYLTAGMGWSAEHVLVRKGENAGTWSTHVVVENTSGRDYADATLKLVAGDPRRTGGGGMPMPRAMEMKAMAADAPADMTQQNFADYHLYTLGRPATLRDREQQTLAMLDPRAVKLAPRYLYRGGDARGVTTQLVVKNDKADGLGEPLPAGRVRFYEADASGAPQFTGETTIGHTADGEKLTLDVGQAFDLVAERRDLFSRRVSDREREYGVEIKLRNRKKSDVTIVVEESAGGDVEITKQSHPSTRKDASTLQFSIAVPAGKEVVLTYSAHQRW
jgi:hypothetical protein